MAVERVGIEIEVMGYQEALNQMKTLDRLIDKLKGKKIDITGFREMAREVGLIRAEMEQLREAMGKFGAEAASMKQAAAGMKQVAQETEKANASAQKLKKNMTIGQMFNKNTSAVAHLGSAMQSAGNAMQRFLAPWRLLVGGAALGAGFSAINKVSEGLSSGFERYDIMKKYNRMMEGFQKGSYTTQKSIDALDKSVQGLPTGLDEMVNLAQRFTMTTGDMKKGTELAIATNNAFLASMATDTQRYQGMMQMQDVLGGKDMNAKEWQALANSMMPAIRMMGESLGKTGKELDQYVADVQQGKISNEEFIKTLQKAGQEGGKIYKMAQESKNTWQAFSSRIGTAFSRMTYGILLSLDELVKTATNGKFESLNEMLDAKVIPGINKMAAAVQNWIKANPDKIKDFFNDLKGIDWKGLGKGFLQGVGDIAKAVQTIAKHIKGKDLEGLGKLFSKLLWLAPGLTITGGLIKGGRHIFGGILTGLEVLAGGLATIKLGGAASKLGKFVSFFKNLGKVEKAAGAVGKVAGAAGTAGGAAAGGAIFKGFLPAIEVIGGIGAITTEITGIAAIDTGLISLAVKNISSITKTMQTVFDNVKGLKGTTFNKEALRTAVNNMFSIYDILYGEKKGSKTRAANKAGVQQARQDGLGGMNKGALKKTASAMASMSKILGTMYRISKQVGRFKNFKGFEKGTLDAINGFITDLGGIYDGMKTSFEESGVDAEEAGGFADLIAKSTGMFTNIGKIAQLIPNLQKQLAPIMQRGVGTGGMGYNAIENIKNMLTGEGGLFSTLGQIMQSVYTDLLWDTEGGGRADISQAGIIATAIENVKSMFTSISEVVALLPTIQEQLAPLTQFGGGDRGNSSMLTTIKENIVGLFQRIGEIYSAFDEYIGTGGEGGEDMAAKFSGVVDAVSQIQSIVSQLNSLGEGGLASTDGAAFTAIDNIKAMVQRLGQALNTETLGQLQEQVATFKANVDAIFQTLNGDLSNVEVTVNISGKVTGHDALIAQIKAADSAIRNAVNSIRTHYSKTVHISINRSVSVSGSIPSNAGGFHTGGQVGRFGKPLYRRGGGDTFFRPRGTDTVPAMLTPGEYVHRKAAVDFFGVRFMQKINNLDIAGAMRELSAKAGARTSMASGTTIYNNITHNNSPTFNQTVHTSNRNFAMKRANRFVGALT